MSMRRFMPSSVSPLEEEMARITESIDEIETELIATVWNADKCPASLLPVLASALSVDIWDETWPEERKRRAIREAPYYHAIKGTDESIAMILSLLGCRSSRTEWWETSPQGRRGTFHVRVYVVERLLPAAPLLTEKLFKNVVAAVKRAKPKSRSFTIDMLIGIMADVGVLVAGNALAIGYISARAAPVTSLKHITTAEAYGNCVNLASGLVKATPFSSGNQMRDGLSINMQMYWPNPKGPRVLSKWFAAPNVGEWLRQDFIDAGTSPWGYPAFYLETRDITYGRNILLNRWLMHRRPDAVEEWGDVLPIGSPYDAAPQFKTLVFETNKGIIWGGRLYGNTPIRQPIRTDILRTVPQQSSHMPWDNGYQTVEVDQFYPYLMHQGQAYLDVIRISVRQVFFLSYDFSDASSVSYEITYLHALGLGNLDLAVSVNGVPSGGRYMTRYEWRTL